MKERENEKKREIEEKKGENERERESEGNTDPVFSNESKRNELLVKRDGRRRKQDVREVSPTCTLCCRKRNIHTCV